MMKGWSQCVVKGSKVVVVVVCSEDGIVWMGKVQKWEQQMMLVLA